MWGRASLRPLGHASAANLLISLISTLILNRYSGNAIWFLQDWT